MLASGTNASPFCERAAESFTRVGTAAKRLLGSKSLAEAGPSEGRVDLRTRAPLEP
jgi:hypothetical protein